MKKIKNTSLICFIVFLVFKTTLYGQFPNPLLVPEQIQQGTFWCWAACSASVLSYYGYPQTQCNIANYARIKNILGEFGTLDCCLLGNDCDHPNYMFPDPGSIQDILDHFSSSYISSAGSSGALTFVNIQAVINDGRPFIIRWGFSSGGHFIVGRGYDLSSPGLEKVHYMDPAPGQGYKTFYYSWMVNGSGHTWTHTLTLTPSPAPPILNKYWNPSGPDDNWFNPNNWTPPGVPTTENVVISAGTPHAPVILGGIATTGALTVALGVSINVKHTGSLTTYGLYTNNGGLLIADDDPSGDRYAGSFIDKGGLAGTGTFEFDRNVICSGSNPANPADPFGWHYLSAPIDGFTTDNMKDYYVKDWSEVTHKWLGYSGTKPCIPYSPAAPLTAMDAWSVNYDSKWPYNGVSGGPCVGGTGAAVEFMGPFTATHTGAFDAPYTFTPGAYQGWNLIGNPYPSGLAMKMIVWPASLVAGAAFYDGCACNYVHWSPALGPYTMSPTLGFFVEANAPDVLALTGAERAHGADLFWKSDLTDLLTLQATGEGGTDVTHVRFMDDVTAGFDNNGDFHKLISSKQGMPQIYTLAGSEKLAINALPETETISMGFTANGSGTYTIEATETSDFSQVYLEDKVTGTVTDLLIGSYSFSYQSGDNPERFVIHFKDVPVNSGEEPGISVFSAQNNVIVGNSNNQEGNVAIYNIVGQCIKAVALESGINTIALDNTNGIYIVKVNTTSGVVNKKVYIQ